MPYRENECTPETCSAARRVAELEREVEKLQKPSWWSRFWRKRPLPALPAGRSEGEYWLSGERRFTIHNGKAYAAKANRGYWYSVDTGNQVSSWLDALLDRKKDSADEQQLAKKRAANLRKEMEGK